MMPVIGWHGSASLKLMTSCTENRAWVESLKPMTRGAPENADAHVEPRTGELKPDARPPDPGEKSTPAPSPRTGHPSHPDFPGPSSGRVAEAMEIRDARTVMHLSDKGPDLS
ncbi:MAG: hypothetical protein LBR80_08115 [Deltaproteobacteria bacterium]|jgi:hypothetical protein|nr:hypothetical protein [Deltaproteobacteria bacterium]